MTESKIKKVDVSHASLRTHTNDSQKIIHDQTSEDLQLRYTRTCTVDILEYLSCGFTRVNLKFHSKSYVDLLKNQNKIMTIQDK